MSRWRRISFTRSALKASQRLPNKTSSREGFDLYVNDEFVKRYTPPGGNNVWQDYSVVIKGRAGQDKIEFREIASQNNSVGVLLDDVRLVKTADPANLLVNGSFEINQNPAGLDMGSVAVRAQRMAGIISTTGSTAGPPTS